MYIACQNGHKNIVSLLLVQKADLKARDSVSYLFVFFLIFFFLIVLYWQNGKTPLHIACANGHKDIVSLLLLAKKPDLEATDSVSHLLVLSVVFFFFLIVLF